MGISGLGDWFHKRLDATGAQLNPFDNGATYNTVMQNKQIAPGPSVGAQLSSFGRGIVHPFSTFGSAAINTPDAIWREIQNKPIDDIQQKVFGTTDPGSIGRQIAGDTAAVGLSVLAPGVSKFAETGAARILPSVVPRLGVRVVANSVAGAPLGAGFNEANLVASNNPINRQNVFQAAKSGAEGGALLGGAVPVAGAGARAGVRVAGATAQDVASAMKHLSNASENSILPQNFRLSVNDKNTLKDYLAYMQGDYKPDANTINQLLRDVRTISQKTGQDFYSGDHVANTGNLVSFLRQRQAAGQGGFIRNPWASEPGPEPSVPVQQPAPVKIANPTPELAPGEKLSRFANRTVPQSPEVSPELQQMVKGENVTYQGHTDAGRMASAQDFIKNKPTDQAFSEAIQGLTRKGANDQDVFNAIALAKKLDATGNESDSHLATELLAEASKTGSTGGQLVQAFASLDKRTPEGLHYAATRTLKKAGVELTPEIKSQIKARMDEIKGTAEGSDQRAIAAQKLVEYTNQLIPRSKMEAGIDFWRAGLLTGPETVAKIATSHLFTTPMEMLTRPVTALTDKAVSAVTGKRTVTFSPTDYIKVGPKGLGEGAVAAGKHVKTGLDMPNTGGFGHDFGTAHHQTPYERAIYRVHGSVYKPFYRAAYRVEEANQRRLAEAQFGNDSKAVEAYMNSPKAIKEMTDYAAQFAMQNQTAPGQLTQMIQHFKPGGVPIGQWIAPFSRIPAALGVKGMVDYTPIGTARAVYQLGKAVSGKGFDQRKFSESLSKSTIGGTGLVALGGLLMANGRMTLQEPSDAKEKALWNAEGKQRNSIKIGDKWVTLNAFGPVGIALGVGGAFQRALHGGAGGESAIPEAIGAGAKLIADQPYMKGVTGVGNVLQDPVRYAGSYVQNSVTSLIPAGVQQIARGTDTTARTYPDTMGNAIKAGLPGARETLPVQRNIYGDPMQGSGRSGVIGGIIGTVNPFYPMQAQNQGEPGISELQRLYDALGSSDAPHIAQPDRNFTINGNKIKVSNDQLSQFIAQSGPTIKVGLNNLVKDPAYQQLNDQQKADLINSQVITPARDAQQVTEFGNNPKNLSAQAADILAGNPGNLSSASQSVLDKVAFQKFADDSSQKFVIHGDQVWYKDGSGNAQTMPKVEYDFNIQNAKLNLAMDRAQNAGDLNAWMDYAQQQYDALEKKKQLYDPGTQSDKIDAITLQQENLLQKADKYQSYGGFTKGGGKGKALPSISVAPPSDLSGPVVSRSSLQAPSLKLKNKRGVPSVKTAKAKSVKITMPKKLA